MSRRTALLVAAGLAAVLVVVAAAAYASAEIVERGHLLPWAGDDVRKVRIFDRFDLYISSEAGRPTPDLVNSYLLAATATICLTAALLLPSPQVRPLLVAAGIGTGYLAMDEQFALHETIGHNLAFLADLPGVKRPDDVIFALYAVPAVLFLVYFWPVLMTSRRAARLLVTTIVLFGVSGIWDVLGLPHEEIFELLPSLTLLASFLLLSLDVSRGPRAAA